MRGRPPFSNDGKSGAHATCPSLPGAPDTVQPHPPECSPAVRGAPKHYEPVDGFAVSSPGNRRTAVDERRGAGYERRIVGRQVKDRTGKLFGLRDPL